MNAESNHSKSKNDCPGYISVCIVSDIARLRHEPFLLSVDLKSESMKFK